MIELIFVLHKPLQILKQEGIVTGDHRQIVHIVVVCCVKGVDTAKIQVWVFCLDTEGPIAALEIS